MTGRRPRDRSEITRPPFCSGEERCEIGCRRPGSAALLACEQHPRAGLLDAREPICAGWCRWSSAVRAVVQPLPAPHLLREVTEAEPRG